MANYVPTGNDGKPASRGNYVIRGGLHCEVFESGWNYKVWQSSDTGQLEHKLWPRLVYIAQGDPDDSDDADVWAEPPIDQSGTVLEAERLERLRLLSLEKSARRAKQSCIHKIKEAGFDSLLTVTYKENMKDFDRMRRDWNYMLRKLQASVPNFAAVYAFEPQDRGAYHCHAAIRKLPSFLWVKQGNGRGSKLCMVRSWDYIRRCWHAIVGKAPDGKPNGNIDVDGHRKRGRKSRGGHYAAESLARLASYVGKYLTKDHATGPPGRNRWGSTQGITPPKPRLLTFPAMPMIEMMSLIWHVPDGHRIVQHSMGKDRKFWCLFTEADPDRPRHELP